MALWHSRLPVALAVTDRYASKGLAGSGAGFLSTANAPATFEPVIERRFQPCGHNPRAKFMRHTVTLQPGRTPVRRNT